MWDVHVLYEVAGLSELQCVAVHAELVAVAQQVVQHYFGIFCLGSINDEEVILRVWQLFLNVI